MPDVGDQLGGRGGFGEVGGEDMDLDAVAQLGGERIEAIRPAGGEDQVRGPPSPARGRSLSPSPAEAPVMSAIGIV